MFKKKNRQIEAERFDPAPQEGLSEELVRKRTGQGLGNYAKTKTGKSYRAIFFTNIFTFFNLIWAVVAVILFYVEAYEDTFFLIIITANTLVGITQEVKAKRTVEKLTLMTAPETVVIRGGNRLTVPTSQIVLDDIVVLSAGNQIGADCIVREGNIEVNESLLTGESIPVKKAPGDSLFAGSFVTAGTCRARADKVGLNCYIQQLSAQAKKLKEPVSQLLKSLKLIINVIGILLIPLAGLVFYRNQQLLGGIHNHQSLTEAITKSAGAVIGMIPSGMFLLTSVALAVGVINLGKKRTLVRDMYCIEMLARTTVLCLDKTGTITDGSMQVNSTVAVAKERHPHGDILSSLMYATEDSNMTALAITARFGSKAQYRAVRVISFSSARKYSAATFEKEGTYALGAPEFVVKNLPDSLRESIDSYAAQGIRVLLAAYSRRAITAEDELPQDMSPAFLVLIEDNIRQDAPQTIQWFKENNVKVKIISGDNPITVAEVARRAGVDGYEQLVNLEGLSDNEVYKAATKFTVFGRVSPEQKAIIVRALKASGETVAMTGDGVNDILSLKESDCSVAMAAGSEATRNVANLVLMDSNFSAMPKVVEEGRRVINNIEKTSSLFLMKTLFVLMLVPLLSLIPLAQLPYPFSPKQMMVLEIFVIGMPAFFLALQPDRNLIRGKFINTIFKRALPPALTMLVCVLTIYLFHEQVYTLLGYDRVDLSTPQGMARFQQVVTLCIACTTIVGFVALFIVCLPFNRYRAVMFVFMAAAGVSVMAFMPWFFDLKPITPVMALMFSALMVAAVPFMLLIKWLINRKPRHNSGAHTADSD